MSTPVRPSRPVWAAVLPSAPEKYDQMWMARLTDIVNKLIEQLVEPRQVTAASAVFSDLPQETPRLDIEGEVYTKQCLNCGCVVLAINQNITEAQQYAQRRWIRTGVSPKELGYIGDSGAQPPKKDEGGGS
jgi:hypothetical protein